MKTFSLRFVDNFAPEGGTIKAHQDIIDEFGYAWFGKLGPAVSKEYIINTVLKNKKPRFLLIESGKMNRYWAYFQDFSVDTPASEKIPKYYRSDFKKFNSWFKITRIVKAEKDVMSKCKVISSGDLLTFSSKYSMSPYFKIEFID